jgi:hypothetical protein
VGSRSGRAAYHIALQCDYDPLAEEQGTPPVGSFITIRLMFTTPSDDWRIGNPLSIYLENPSPGIIDYDNIRLTRYSTPSSLNIETIGDSVTLSATNLIQNGQYHIARTESLTNSPSAWTNVWIFNAETTSTNFTELIPTNSLAPSCFYQLKLVE